MQQKSVVAMPLVYEFNSSLQVASRRQIWMSVGF